MELSLKKAFPSFRNTISDSSQDLVRRPLEILQINMGKLCNQACHHCHVEAGPKRTEIMARKTVDRIVELIDQSKRIAKVDLTGGAPELCPSFRHMVKEARLRKIGVIDRCNLTVFYEQGQKDIPEFLKEYGVEIVASLPCYSEANVDSQRGNGVFAKSIRALKKLNELGYGKPDTGLELSLVYNPLGAYLPPDQKTLELEYKTKLQEDFGIVFNHLFTITNMPIKRFLKDLTRQKKLDEYMSLLLESFNPKAVSEVMCVNQVSIGWDGQIYDCDFNQMLEIPVNWKKRNIWDINSLDEFNKGNIAVANHCYGCTAGAGSSCGGSLT